MKCGYEWITSSVNYGTFVFSSLGALVSTAVWFWPMKVDDYIQGMQKAKHIYINSSWKTWNQTESKKECGNMDNNDAQPSTHSTNGRIRLFLLGMICPSLLCTTHIYTTALGITVTTCKLNKNTLQRVRSTCLHVVVCWLQFSVSFFFVLYKI